jgi:hypothetical protein
MECDDVSVSELVVYMLVGVSWTLLHGHLLNIALWTFCVTL